MHTKKRLTSLIASTLAAIMFLSIFNIAFSSIPASAEDSGEDYLIKYAKDDDTFYFATETKDNSKGLIISPLGYFCSFYDGTTGQYVETVFVTDTTWGRAYYNKDAADYKYRIKRTDIDAKVSSELDDVDQKIIGNLQSNGKLRIVFDTLLSVAYILNGTLYPSITLSKINPTAAEVWNAISAYNGLGSGNFNQGDSTGLFVYTDSGKKVSGAYPAYATACSMIYVSSAIHQTDSRKQSCLGGLWDVSFSKSLYDSFYWTRADCGDSYIQKVFSSGSKISVPAGYFAVPTPPNSAVIENPTPTVDVDLYPTGVTFKDQWGNDATVLVEGNTYTPVFHYYNYGSVGVYARVSGWSYSLWKDVMYDDYGEMSTRIYINAWSEYAITARESFTITPDLNYSDPARKFTDYEYWVNTIKHLLTIGLDCDSSYDADGNFVYVTQNNTGNDQATYTHNFLPKQPSISQWVADEENKNSSWITENSIYGNWKLYSGEQVSSYRWISNNSKFNINIIDNFRAFLGLNNSFFDTSNGEGYFKANGQEGSTWTRKTGVIRAKNTDVNTHKTLYLLDTAAEKSYNQVTGFNYPDMNNIANNVSLNQQQFYQSTSYPSGNGNIMIKQWDNNSRILTLNGTDTTGFYDNTFDFYLKPWTRYRVTVEYVSGSVSSNGVYTCLAFQGYNEDPRRDYVDIQFPYCQAQGTGAVCTGFLDITEKPQNTFRAWLFIASGGQVVFNNYRVKVKIEEVQGTDWDLQYTKHIQGYSIVPTDLQTQSLVLYDADTGVRINEGTVLKAGQRVYVQTTYRNNTEVAVAAELLTVHNNNSNSYYWNTDDGTLKDRVQCDTSSVSNSEFKESLVIAPKQYVTVRSNTFEVSAVNDNKMTIWSQIYLKNLADNTEYEYNGYNNTLYKEFEIETPFKPSIVQANSLYRKGINVITSFKVKNDSKRDFGTTTDVNNYGKLTAKLEIYRNSSMTGTPIVAYADYCVPANGGETLVI